MVWPVPGCPLPPPGLAKTVAIFFGRVGKWYLSNPFCQSAQRQLLKGRTSMFLPQEGAAALQNSQILSSALKGPVLSNVCLQLSELSIFQCAEVKLHREREVCCSPVTCHLSFFLCVSDIAQLRKKFEEDKQRIALMRAQRKFRPY